MTFEEWLVESEVYSLRCERLYSDLVENDAHPYQMKYNLVLKWLKAAYDVGYETGHTQDYNEGV
jgi:hypothetical protein